MLEYKKDSSGAVKALKVKLGEEWEDNIKTVKSSLDQINFEGLYSKEVCYDYELGMYLPKMRTKKKNWSVLEPLKESEIVTNGQKVVKLYNDVSSILQTLPINEKIYPGTVSNGVHATELIERYFTATMVQSIDYWNTKKVMVVYEAPANNLDCCHALMNKCENVEKNEKEEIDEFLKIVNNYIEEKKDDQPISLTDNLTNRWWRLDEQLLRQKNNDEQLLQHNNNVLQCNPTTSCIFNTIGKPCYKCFNSKSYTGFLLALISHFGLANLYTTNYCRIELFEIDEKNGNKESFLNWDETLNLKNGKKVFMKEENLFLDEYEQFMPDIVLASSNPYNRLQYLINGKKKRNDHDSYDRMQRIISNTIKPRIIKMIHPASRYPYDFRLCYNMCMITRELEKIKAITKERADEIFNHFREMNITDYATNNGENNNENDME